MPSEVELSIPIPLFADVIALVESTPGAVLRTTGWSIWRRLFVAAPPHVLAEVLAKIEAMVSDWVSADAW